jgi:hypothetical protein
MIFLNFSQLLKNIFHLKLKKNIFLKINLNFLLTEKYFLLINFSNNKQTQKYLKNNFQKPTFHTEKHHLKQYLRGCPVINFK